VAAIPDSGPLPLEYFAGDVGDFHFRLVQPLIGNYGSSNSTTTGSWANDWASFTRCFIPVEYWPMGR